MAAGVKAFDINNLMLLYIVEYLREKITRAVQQDMLFVLHSGRQQGAPPDKIRLLVQIEADEVE